MIPLLVWRTVGEKQRLSPWFLLPSPSLPGSTGYYRFFWVSVRQSQASQSSTRYHLYMAALGRGPHLFGRLSAAPFPPGHGDLDPRAPPRAPYQARRPEQGDKHTVPRSHSHVRPAPCRCPLPAGTGTGQHLGPRCRARLPVPPPHPRRRPPLHLLLLPARSHSSPPSCLRLRHPGTLQSSLVGLGYLSHRRLWDAGSVSNGEGTRPQASRGWPPWAGTGSGRAGQRGASLGPGGAARLWGLPGRRELSGRRAAACRGEGYSKPRTVARTRWY